MSAIQTPTLEDLRDAPTAAWLWDAGRGRVVWANREAVKAFDATSLFDLIDRTFDPQETGVARIAELGRSLKRGEPVTALLHFPSVGAVVPFECHCHLHALSDGRPGVLAVRVPPRVELTAAPNSIAGQVFAAMPMPLLVLSPEGDFLHGNAAARTLLGEAGPTGLADLLGDKQRAASLLARLSTSNLVNASEKIACAAGLRDGKLVLTRISADGEPFAATLMLEDVTDRRALERDILSQQIARIDAKTQAYAPGADETQKTNAAFDALSKSLAAKLEAQPIVEKPAAPAVPAPATEVSAAKPVPPAPAESVKPPFVPDAVRMSFERTGKAILVARNGTPLFATRQAAELLAYDSVEPLFSRIDVWQKLEAAGSGDVLELAAGNGAAGCFIIGRGKVPWLNGPVDQFVLEATEMPRREEPPAPPAAEVVPTPPEPPVAPEAIAVAISPEADSLPAPVEHPESDRAAAELRAILDVASDGIITLDDAGSILSFSAGAEAIFGLNEAEVLNQPLADLLKPESRKVLRDYLSGIVGPGLATVFNDGREVLAQTREGDPVPLFLSVSRLRSQQSRATLCAVVRDITTWKRTERELRDAKEEAENANRQKSDFLARISHELRTPLNAIMGFSDVMRMERFGPLKNERYRAYSNDIHSSGEHLLALINDLLDLSKVEAGKLELNFTAESIVDATEHAMRMLQEEAKTARVLVRVAFPAKLPRVVADHRSLRQVMLNLLSNSVKYTDAGGQIIVSAALESDGSLVVRVKDSGIGMTEAQLHDALQPFTRVETPDRARQGTGLGLPLTKALVEANRAKLRLTSAPKEGTLAEIVFPGPRVLAE